MKVITVRWRDSRLWIKQEHPDDITDGVCVIDSVGYLVREKKDHIILAGDLIDDCWRRAITIPRENIVKMKVLR